MKFLNAIIFSILICNIFSQVNEETIKIFQDACVEENHHIVDYDKTERVLELDWTDDDSFTLNVEFKKIDEKYLVESDKGIIGFFVNATISEEVDETAYDWSVVNQVDSEGYKLINTISQKSDASSTNYSPKITPSIVAANKEVITEKFYKYFGWIECSGNQVAQLRKSEILVIVNNGKLYQISKYLLFVMAALLL
jgi:hypothetical protein